MWPGSYRGFESLPVRGPLNQGVKVVGDNKGDNDVSAESVSFPRVAETAKRLEVRRVEPCTTSVQRSDVIYQLGRRDHPRRSHRHGDDRSVHPCFDAVAVANGMPGQVSAREALPSGIVAHAVPEALEAPAFVRIS
jgi:hypothetical protein